MATTNYLLMLGIGSVFALLLALANHAAHAYLTLPEGWNRQYFGRDDDEDRRPEGEYDRHGIWEFASLRNYFYHAGASLALVWGPGLWYWHRQADALAQVCGAVAPFGITPVFCM